MEKNVAVSSGRNYQIDVLKLVCAFFVVLSHCGALFNANSVLPKEKPFYFGWVSVHIFFVISGFFMVKSLEQKLQKNLITDPGHSAFLYVLKKYKSIALPFIVSILITLCFYIAYSIYIYIYGLQSIRPGNANLNDTPFNSIIKSIPELLGLSRIGLNDPFNAPGWYISSMLIAMLPLCYILIRNKDFYIYVFAPFAAVILFGVLFYINSDKSYDYQNELNSRAYIQFLRAVCGLCFGAITWIIYTEISKIPEKKRYKVIITIFEIIINVLFFYVWIDYNSTFQILYCIMLLVPVMIAIAFSEKSYINKFFKNAFFKHCDSVSLMIYLNQMVPTAIVTVFVNQNLPLGIAIVFILIALFSFINMLAVKILKAIGKKIVSGA